jgi:small subunit ribosomal protein S10e
LTSRGFVKTSFCWQWYYYTLTPEGLDYLREWLHLPAEIVPQTHIKQQRSAPPRGMLGGDDRERRGGDRGGRGGGRGGDRGGDRDGYRRRDAGEKAEGGAPGEFKPEFRGGFGRGRGGAAPAS